MAFDPTDPETFADESATPSSMSRPPRTMPPSSRPT